MTTKDQPEHILKTDQEKLNYLLRMIIEQADKYGQNFNLDHLIAHIKLLFKYDDQFKLGTSSIDNFPTMTQIEDLTRDLQRSQSDENLRYLMEEMKHLKAEDAIISKKKANTSTKELN